MNYSSLLSLPKLKKLSKAFLTIKKAKDALNIIESQSGEKFDIEKLKTIRYLRKPLMGYANNTVEKAFSYFDKLNNDLYLYIPGKKKIQILTNDNFIKNIKLKI